MNKFMRIVVFFDLPVVTAKEKKAAAKFRKFLIKDGYNMMQWSVYSRICNGTDSVAMAAAQTYASAEQILPVAIREVDRRE